MAGAPELSPLLRVSSDIHGWDALNVLSSPYRAPTGVGWGGSGNAELEVEAGCQDLTRLLQLHRLDAGALVCYSKIWNDKILA